MVAKVVASVQPTCGTCSHYNSGSKAFEELCVYLGTQSFRKACNKYDPRVADLGETWDPELLGKLGKACRDLNSTQLMVLSQTLARAAEMKDKTGLAFGQPVFFCLGRLQNIEDYFKGFVAGWDKRNKWVQLLSTLDGNQKASQFQLKRDSLMTPRQYKEHLESLLTKAERGGRVSVFSPKVTGSYLEYLRKPGTVEEKVAQILAETTTFTDGVIQAVTKLPTPKSKKKRPSVLDVVDSLKVI